VAMVSLSQYFEGLPRASMGRFQLTFDDLRRVPSHLHAAGETPGKRFVILPDVYAARGRQSQKTSGCPGTLKCRIHFDPTGPIQLDPQRVQVKGVALTPAAQITFSAFNISPDSSSTAPFLIDFTRVEVRTFTPRCVSCSVALSDKSGGMCERITGGRFDQAHP